MRTARRARVAMKLKASRLVVRSSRYVMETKVMMGIRLVIGTRVLMRTGVALWTGGWGKGQAQRVVVGDNGVTRTNKASKRGQGRDA